MPPGKYKRTSKHRSNAAKKATRHGGVGTVEHRTWTSMLTRCRNPNCPQYVWYGGRGIRVCKWWLKFENFLVDMGLRPSAIHSLDRRDSNKGYTPSNCRWATTKEQSRNRSSNRFLTLDGKTMTFVEWAEHANLKQSTLKRRIDGLGWPLRKAIETPCRS